MPGMLLLHQLTMRVRQRQESQERSELKTGRRKEKKRSGFVKNRDGLQGRRDVEAAERL